MWLIWILLALGAIYLAWRVFLWWFWRLGGRPRD